MAPTGNPTKRPEIGILAMIELDSQCDPMRDFNFPNEFTVNCSYIVVLSYLKAGITHIVIYGNADIRVFQFPGKLSDFI